MYNRQHKGSKMIHYIVDTKYKKRLVSEPEMLSTYMRAKDINRRDGNRGKLSNLRIASEMGISMSEAAHLNRLNITKLDSIEL